MTIDELISELQKIKSEKGNIKVKIARYLVNEYECLEIEEDVDLESVYEVDDYVRITS